MESLKIFKIGGKVVENEELLDFFLKQFANTPGEKVLVYGGGKWVSEMSRKLGYEVTMMDGRRVTDNNTLEVVKMMLAGVANKTVVSKLQGFGCNALGLTGADGNAIEAVKRPLKDGIDYGYVGDVVKVNGELLSNFIENGLTPVFAAMTHDKQGQMLNTNADTIASSVAVGLSAYYRVELVYFFELPGVLKDISDLDSVIPMINTENYPILTDEGIINDGMIPKIDNAFDALNSGVSSVRICQSTEIDKFAQGQEDFGTRITL